MESEREGSKQGQAHAGHDPGGSAAATAILGKLPGQDLGLFEPCRDLLFRVSIGFFPREMLFVFRDDIGKVIHLALEGLFQVSKIFGSRHGSLPPLSRPWTIPAKVSHSSLLRRYSSRPVLVIE